MAVSTTALVENGVYGNMLKNLAPLQEIHFWRTLAKNEVDFVVVKEKEIKPIEVKYRAFTRPKVPSGLVHFQQKYDTGSGIVLTKDYFSKTEAALFLPVWLC